MDETIKQAFHQFYKTKNTQELKKKKMLAKKKQNLKYVTSRTRKKIMSANTTNLQCLNCKKPGGNIFDIKNNKLTISCGNATPCNYKLEVNRGVHKNIFDEMELYMKMNELVKGRIIKVKLNILFGYISEEEGIKEFERLEEKFEENNKILFEINRRIQVKHSVEIKSGDKLFENLVGKEGGGGDWFVGDEEEDVLASKAIELNFDDEGNEKATTMSKKRFVEAVERKIQELKTQHRSLGLMSKSAETSVEKASKLKEEQYELYREIMLYDKLRREELYRYHGVETRVPENGGEMEFANRRERLTAEDEELILEMASVDGDGGD